MAGRINTVVALILVAALVAVPLVAQDWAGKGRAQGLVKDEGGDPLAGATVTLLFPPESPIGGPESVTTNKKGRWSYLGLRGGNWKVLIELEGYIVSEGVLYVNEFQPAKAVETIMVADPGAAITKGEELLGAGNYAEARIEYEKALKDMDDLGQARLRSRIGDTYLAEGSFAAARAEYEKALPHIPSEEQTHIRLQMANSFQQEGKYSEAREQYEALLPGLTPEGQAQVLRTVAQGYGLQGNNAKAIEALEKANELAPGDPDVLQLLADLLMREGRGEEAESYLAQLPEDVELPTDMVLNMGIRLYNEGDMDKALEFFNRSVEEHPEEASAYYYRGLTLLSKGDKDGAKADFNKLMQIAPDTPHRAEVEEFLKFLEQGP